MMTNPRPGRLALRAGAAAGFAFHLCACVVDDPQTQARQQLADAGSAQPRRAVYDCGADGKITVEATHAAVRLVDAQGDTYELPASPPSQSNRFGEGGLALVVEGGEALWMRAGKPPQTCTR